LADTSIADIASWADEVRSKDPHFKYASPWHYLEFTMGMNYADFSAHVLSMGPDNVYGAILKCEHDLQRDTTTRANRIIALKFLVHFIGDCHQPMHLSKAEDKGGNMVQVQFNGKGTNLHGLWDTGLITRDGKTYDQMARDYDTASPAQIKQWQSDAPMQWIFESYEAAGKFYADLDKNGNKLDDAYYNENIPAVRQRIEMAGILAGELNTIFK
jgi:hypothetical protein